jgi:hypothetical protein
LRTYYLRICGVRVIRKNGLLQRSPGTWALSYDEDLWLFKVIDPHGNIWTKFAPHQIIGTQVSQTEGIRKKTWLGLRVKFSSGDEYGLSYNIAAPEDGERMKGWIQFATKKERALNEAMTLISTRERVEISEISSILQKYSLPSTESDSKKLVESGLTTKKIEGYLEGNLFICKKAQSREQVKYDITARFEVSKSGVIILKCPSCGATLPIKGKESTGTCEYCSTSYAIPRKALDLI